MRSLTSAEASVLRSLLADEPLPHRERVRRSGLPARTYEVARSRLRVAGSVVERYIPDPIRLGRPFVRFTLTRPFAERFGAEARRWRESERAVLVWEGAGVLFAVSFEPGPDDRAGPAGVEDRGISLCADLRQPAVPAYFDFEGAWSRWADVPGTARYPRPLAPFGDRGRGFHSMSATDRTVVRHLVLAPFDARPNPMTSPDGWIPRRRLRRALAEGLVEHRVFLDVTQISPYRGRRIESVILLHARLRADGSAPELFRSLVSRSRVAPFLFVTDGRRILLGGLSPAPEPGSAPSRVPVLTTLEGSLEGIDVTRIPVEGLVTSVNHRYERLLEEPE